MTKLRLILITVAGGLALTGCSTVNGLFAQPDTITRAAAADNCGAQALSYHVGHGLAPDVESDIKSHIGTREVRYIPALYRGRGDPQASRLDVYYHADNRVINAMVCS